MIRKFKKKSILITPARCGSNRIPLKNIKSFLVKPIIYFPIKIALKSNLLDKVVVSTDNMTIAKIAKKLGAEVHIRNPKYADAQYNLGIVYQEQNESKTATNLYMKAISLNPNYIEAYNNLATTLKEQGKTNEAIELYKKALTLNPNYAEAYYNLGKIQKENNKLEESIKS